MQSIKVWCRDFWRMRKWDRFNIILAIVSLLIGIFSGILGTTLNIECNNCLIGSLNSVLNIGDVPRTLSQNQKQMLIEKLSVAKNHSVGVYSYIYDGESSNYAEEISETFKEAGWNVLPIRKLSLNELPGYVTFFMSANTTCSSICEYDFNLIINAFKYAAVPFKLEQIKEGSIPSGGRQADMVYIVVGQKS